MYPAAYTKAVEEAGIEPVIAWKSKITDVLKKGFPLPQKVRPEVVP